MKTKLDPRGKWVLITGASSGLGELFAYEFANRGANLILVARREKKLKEVADSSRKINKVEVEAISMDLSLPESSRHLFEKIQNFKRKIYGLVNNAGFAVYGKLHKTSVAKNQEEILLNVFTLASLTQLFLPEMVNARDGLILNVASTAAFQPLPYMANYGASKAFVLSFTEALWAEYQDSGIRILAVCPGATETPFFDVVGAKEASVGKRGRPENVVKAAFHALEKNRIYVITGPRSHYWLAQSGRFLPRAFVAKTTEKVMHPKND